MDTGIESLAKEVVRGLSSGPLVQFSCTPRSAVSGDRVLLTAVFYATPFARLTNLKPAVKCVELPKLEVVLSPEASGDSTRASFRGELDTRLVAAPQGILSLALHPRSEASAIAGITLHIFTKRELNAAKTVSVP